MGGPATGSPVKYHYSHRFFTYSMRQKATLPGSPYWLKVRGAPLGRSTPARSDSRTLSGGEFDWGGTSVKH